MNKIVEKTDIHSIKAAARAIREIDRVCYRTEDDNLWIIARRNLFAIIETGGYMIDPEYKVKPVNYRPRK